MQELHDVIKEVLEKNFIQIILSNTRDIQFGNKVKIRPILLKNQLFFQESLYKGTQVFHSNFSKDKIAERIESYLKDIFRQGELKTQTEDIIILVGKKGNIHIKRKKKIPENMVQKIPQLAHNRTKQYILQEGIPVDFLIGLGVQTSDGKITKTKYDKFRQINRYLEFIEDILEELPRERTIRIIDFGCGKSYLTFAMYYYLHEVQKRDIEVTGLDLKADVIAHCNELAKKLHYEKLHFERGDISTYTGADMVDMVVSLHACDTATDYALEKAVKWGASVIMAVPCCQHEVNSQIKNDILAPVLKYGLIKERISALVTDAVRANLLEQQGYQTQILEFIDMEHTPKNLLIRAVKSKGMKPVSRKNKVEDVLEFLQISPTLECLLKEEMNGAKGKKKDEK